MSLRRRPRRQPSASSNSRSRRWSASTGTLTNDGSDDPDDFYLGPIELDFGPDTWVMTAGPIEDFDGDGRPRRLLNELDGLVGRQVTALVRFDADGDDANVYRLNDRTYRDSASGRPPRWEPRPYEPDAASSDRDGRTAAAAAAVGRGARSWTDLERQSAGEVAWEAVVLTDPTAGSTPCAPADADRSSVFDVD